MNDLRVVVSHQLMASDGMEWGAISQERVITFPDNQS